jgi:stage II sporulation protein D
MGLFYMKRIFTVPLKNVLVFGFIFIVTLLYMNANNVYAAQQSLNIKVGLKYGKTALSVVNLSFSNGVSVENYDGLQNKVLATLNEEEKLTIKKNVITGKIEVYNALNKMLISADIKQGSYIRFIPLDYGDLKSFKFGNNIYRGNALLYNYSGVAFNLINELDLEQYVYGVVPREVSPSWNAEALKAQAVAARTYAVKNVGKHKKYGFDLCADTDCQVYGGFNAEDPRSNKAVDDTKGKIIYYNNKAIDAVFFATSGGSTEDSVNVWGTDIPYLKGVDDSLEPQKLPLKTWKKTFNLENLKSILSARKIDIGDITDLKVDEFSKNGRALSVTFVGTKGTKTYKKDNIRAALGLYSTYFTIQKTGNSSQPTDSIDKIYIASGDSKVVEAGKSVNILGQDSSEDNVTLNGKTIISDNQTKTIGNEDEVQQNGKVTFIINGKGNGHGVGMSQNGAKGMADSGKDYVTILKHYYTGVEVK